MRPTRPRAGCQASRRHCIGTCDAPVNLTPIVDLERHLHRLQGKRTPRRACGARGGAGTDRAYRNGGTLEHAQQIAGHASDGRSALRPDRGLPVKPRF